MSFSGTPLGQARRLDRETFLGKPSANGNRPPSPSRIIPASYTLPAPLRSPPRPSSPTREPHPDEGNSNEPALARFARQKQREAALLAARPGGTKVITSPPNPTRWNVKDTTVNIAAAFTQAANSGSDMAPTYNPNHSWASSSRTSTHVPRSTSVEYEQQASATQGRRLAVPNRFPGRGATAGQKPPSKSRSLQHVPDSEGEEVGPGGRAKSPFEQIVEAARNALDPAIYYLRQKSTEPENRSGEHSQASINGSHAGNDSSYNYEEEERFVQKSQAQTQSQRNAAKPRKGRISVDNQAWKPSTSDIEDSDDDEPEKRQRRKKNMSISRMTNLPTVVDGKTTKKRRPKGSKNISGGFDDDDGVSEDNSYTDISASMSAAQLRASVPRLSVEPPAEVSTDLSMDVAEQGLQSIPEVPEEDLAASKTASEKPRMRPRRTSRSTTPVPRSQRFSIGALLGTFIRYIVTTITGFLLFIVKLLSSTFFLFGRATGTVWDVLLNRPYQWVTGRNRGAVVSLVKYIVLGVSILTAWYALQNPAISSRLPSLSIGRQSPDPVFTAPGVPVANIDELVKRLTQIEAALTALSTDNAKIKLKTEDGVKSYADVLQRIGSVEGRITSEARRISDAESQARNGISRSINTVKQEVEDLQAQLEAQKRQQEKEKQQQQQQRPAEPANDEEARNRLRALEDRVGSVEGGVKEALELGKKVSSVPAPAPPAPAPSHGAAWWSKIISKTGNKEGLKITTPDGQDVTGLISHLVDNAVSVIGKDGLAKPDFAMYSAGGRVIPSLTSPTFEVKPSTVRSTIVGMLTGNGYAIGHPPVIAIEPGLHAGRCWPIAGPTGQLGVALAVPAFVDEITVDHVAKEVAFDMRTAPRQMEVWGLVEGQDNVEKLREYRQQKIAKRKEEFEAAGEVLDEEWEKRELEKEREGYPATLPKNPEYLRIAKFTYDIHASQNVQTFKIDPEVKELGVDFGVVVARVLNNWGHDSYTCLYRFRVHGQMLGEQATNPYDLLRLLILIGPSRNSLAPSKQVTLKLVTNSRIPPALPPSIHLAPCNAPHQY
ncbi:hypothetical protein EST38_g7322 [Candolleomyces aberdarensis]|uniref:SUN domain-containing protein n=1 Tax=Candolleomyces aberdarensis TaxID=2316362 RepID=A0A4Q2DFE2_9AGAR|nr:hypothetical protein EST38_g7322 [Candolleomyces aberdarensis]